MPLLTLKLLVCILSRNRYGSVVNFHLTAVAAQLALYKFTLKTTPPSRFNPNLKEPIPEKLKFSPVQPSKEWDRGEVYGKAQNLARTVRLSTKARLI